MPRLSTLSNPTGLVELDKLRVGIALDEGGKRPAFSLVKLDLSDLSLPAPLNVVVIARRGNSEERVELGPISEWKRTFQELSEIGSDGSWEFRVLLVQPNSPKLIAVAERVRPEGQGDSSSFVGLEPADLGQRPWEIVISEADGRAVIRFNREIYLSPGAAEADSFFIGMILPEAIRRVAEFVSANPGALEEAWSPFKYWLALHGITDEPGDTDDQKLEWCSQVTSTFCDRFEFANRLKDLRNKAGDE
jgi:hypothetical protein